MNFDDILKKTPSRLKVKERTAVGFLATVIKSIQLDFIDPEAKDRLLKIADKLDITGDRNYNMGVTTGTYFTTIFSYFRVSKKDIEIWALKARDARIELITGAEAQRDDAASRIKKYKLFDFNLATPVDINLDFWRKEMEDLKNNIGIVLAWRALAITLDKALGIPWIRQVADFGDIYDAIEKNNKEVFKMALFLNHGQFDPDAIESLKWWQTAPLEALLWEPYNAEIEHYAKEMEDVTTYRLVTTMSHYLARGNAQCGF